MAVHFEKGDLLVASTDVDDSNIDLRRLTGAGRILHFDHDFELKNTLWTDQVGLVVGLGIDPRSGDLYSADPHNQNIVSFDADGQCKGAIAGLPKRPFGTIAFDDAGHVLLGVHSARQAPPEDAFGAGKLFVWDPETNEVAGHEPEIDGGRTGWHCITSMTYDPSQAMIYYASEGGRRVARYQITERRQAPDFKIFDESAEARTYGVALLSSGDLLMATGNGACRMNSEGDVVQTYEVPLDKGWTRISLAHADADYFYLNNFLEGILQRRRISTGEVLVEYDIKRKCSLCGVTEVTR